MIHRNHDISIRSSSETSEAECVHYLGIFGKYGRPINAVEGYDVK